MPASGRPPLPRSGDYVSPNRSQGSPPLQKPLRGDARQEEDDLFDPPPDLVCPITHEVFSDPVLNSAGQVYERSSIEQHLARHNTDPITGTRLTSKVLTPVYFLKSRAAEFREAAARGCVEQATNIGTANAIRYVRRAAELCDALANPVLGLSQECVDYIKAHPSNVYDMPALHLFAKGLLQSGQRDKAAAVYFTLLQEGADKAQQASLLRQCLACWNVGAETGSAEETVEMLVNCVEQSDSLPPIDIVDIAQEAKLDHAFIARFCEQLLFRRRPGGDAPLSPRDWGRQKQILLKYVQVSCSYVAQQQAIADARMQQVSEAAEELKALAKRQQSPAESPSGKGQEGGRQKRLVSGLCLAASCLLPRPEFVAVRLLKAASVIALVHFTQ